MIVTSMAYPLSSANENLRSGRRSLSDIVNSFQYWIAGLMLTGTVNKVLIPPKNALRFQASRMMQGLEEGGPKPFSFRLMLR